MEVLHSLQTVMFLSSAVELSFDCQVNIHFFCWLPFEICAVSDVRMLKFSFLIYVHSLRLWFLAFPWWHSPWSWKFCSHSGYRLFCRRHRKFPRDLFLDWASRYYRSQPLFHHLWLWFLRVPRWKLALSGITSASTVRLEFYVGIMDLLTGLSFQTIRGSNVWSYL